MKNVIVWRLAILLFVLFGTQQMLAQSCPAPPPAFEKSSLVGEWNGQYTHEGQQYTLNVKIRLEGEKIIATTALPDLNIPTSEFTSWVCQSNELHMRLDLPENRAVKFIGRPVNDSMNGRFVFNETKGVCSIAKDRFTLVKTPTSARME